jgi:hypothetical protein
MTQLYRQAVLILTLMIAATTVHAQRVAAPARSGVSGHYLLSDNVGTWRHTSAALGDLTITLGSNGVYRFSQVKDGKTKRLAGEYAFVDERGRTDLLLFSGPRAPKKQPSVRWSYSKTGKDLITLRNRLFYRGSR